VYQPIRQANLRQFNLVVKFASAPTDAQALIRKAAASTNRDVPVNELASFGSIGERADEGDNFNFNLYIGFILIALYLCGAATYGLAARAATRRRVETGIRMALGAGKGASMLVFMKDGFRMVVAGLGIGSVTAMLLSYWSLSTNEIPVNIAPILLPVIAGICVIMGTLVMLANYFPAKRIIAMEPGDALRHE
jgi:ABC-type antimicrobial peptide transport system permease subunit